MELEIAMTRLAADLCVLHGAVNTGVLTSGDRAVLFDCCDTVTPEALAALGVRHVDAIFCTQHRRPNTAGVYPFLELGAAVIAPAAERHLFEDVDTFWGAWLNRWHLADVLPPAQVAVRAIPVARAVAEGDSVEWQGYAIRVIETPGATAGAVSYVVEVGGSSVCFSGDVLYGPGQLWELYSLQRHFGVISDYHGFLGSRQQLLPSLQRLASVGADLLVPAHGEVMRDPAAAVAATIERLEAVWHNYCSISALNFYFPHLLDDTIEDPARFRPAPQYDVPPFVRFVAYTSFAVVSDSGAALLLDCGHDSVVDTLGEWLRSGAIASVDGCWVSHYHYDHVDSLYRLPASFGCPIFTDRSMAEVIEHPSRFYLPCVTTNPAPVARATTDGESWQWHEFRLTALHLPGQTLYHSGLLVEGHGTNVLFVGDSFAPTGVDDYCASNRNFLRREHGLRRCLGLVHQYRPQYLVNQHQQRAFAFGEGDLDYLEATLAERERLLAQLLPWAHPDFGTDEWWVRAYPYEQEATPGGLIAVDVQFTNHGAEETSASVEPVLPEGWRWEHGAGGGSLVAPAQTDGLADAWCRLPDVAVRLWLRLPADARPGRYTVPFRVTWGGRYLGQVRHAIVVVR
ncbi:MAG: MBL fold metallo-hydrolase [Anaerolineae bacterium]